MFLNLTNHLSKRAQHATFSPVQVLIIIGCVFLLWPWAPAQSGESQAFRQRWHQLQLRQFSQEDVKTEIRFGREVSARILANFRLSHQTELMRYLNLVGQSLANHGQRSEISYHFAVLDSTTVGAYSAPGGYVFLTSALLDIIDNEAELAAVLAHEIAHINLRHIVNDLNIKATSKEELSAFARFIGASGDTTRAVFNQAVDKAYEVLFKNGYKKNQELQADARAYELLIATGYDPSALASIVQRIAQKTKSDKSKTHPQFDRRYQQLNQLALQSGVQHGQFYKATERFKQQLQGENQLPQAVEGGQSDSQITNPSTGGRTPQ